MSQPLNLVPQPGDGQPQRSSRVRIWAVLAVIVVAAMGIGGYFLFRSDDKNTDDAAGTQGRTITLPATFGGYHRITSLPTETLKAQLGQRLAQFGGDPSSTVTNAQVGVYGIADDPSVIFVSIALKDVPKLEDKVASDGVEAAVRQFAGGANNQVSGGGSPKSVFPGVKGGTMLCSSGDLNGSQVGFCGWGDRSVFAITIVTGTTPAAAAAVTTRELREAAES